MEAEGVGITELTEVAKVGNDKRKLRAHPLPPSPLFLSFLLSTTRAGCILLPGVVPVITAALVCAGPYPSTVCMLTRA